MKKVVGFVCTGLVLKIVLLDCLGCWCVTNNIPKFNECIDGIDLVIRSLNDRLQVNYGNSEYSIDSKGVLSLIKGNNNELQIKPGENGSFDVSMLNGLVNFRAKKEKNELWHLMPFNTDYSGKLAVEADYIDLCNVKADKVVISAKKDQVENSGTLCAQDIKILSHFIYNKDLIHSMNSNSQVKLPQVKDSKLKKVFASGFRDFENQNGKYKGFWNEGTIEASHVDTKELEADLCGNSDITEMNSDKPVVFGYLPAIEKLSDYNIQISQLNAPSVTLYTSEYTSDEQVGNGTFCHKGQYNELNVGLSSSNTTLTFKRNPPISMKSVYSALDINFKVGQNPSLDSIQNVGNIIAQIPSLFKSRNQDCRTIVLKEIKKKAQEIGFSNYKDLNKLKAEILSKKKELFKSLGLDPDYTWDQLPEELDKKAQDINEACEAENVVDASNPDERIQEVNALLQRLNIQNVSTKNILALLEELYKQKDKLVSDLSKKGWNLDQYDISTWDKLYTRITSMFSLDENMASLISRGETLCSVGKKVLELREVALNQLEEMKQLKGKIMHLLYLMQIADDIDAIKFSLESQEEPFVLFDPRGGEDVFKGQATSLNGVPCGNSTASFLFIRAACAAYEKEVEYSDSLREAMSSRYLRIPLSLFKFINRITTIKGNLSDQNVESLIEEVEKLNFDSDANLPYISKLLYQLKLVKLDWADIARRFIHIKTSFADAEENLRKLYYRVAVSQYMQNRSETIVTGRENYSKRIKTVIEDLGKVFAGTRAIYDFLHGSSGDDMMKLAKIVDGDLRLVIYYGNLLSFNNYDGIQFPDFLTYLLMDDQEYIRNTSEWADIADNYKLKSPLNFVRKNIEGEALFSKLIGNDYDNLQRSFSNEDCSKIFLKALGIIFHGNSSQYETIDAVMLDLQQHPGVFANSNADFKAPLYDVLSNNHGDIRKGLLQAFSVLFDTDDYGSKYDDRGDMYRDGGVYSDKFGKNRIMYLFELVKSFV